MKTSALFNKTQIVPFALLATVMFLSIPQRVNAARGRPYINFGAGTNGVSGTTFVADNGNLIRGMICGSDITAMPQITNYGCNALHLYAESASGGTAGYNSNLVDSAVAMTRTNGLYLIITIGGGGVNLTFDTAFWSFYAPRYANETHVIYEIQNEVDSGAPSSASVIQLETNCYNIIEASAPNTPVLFFSYVAFNSGSGVVQDINALGSGINWSNAAVAFHGYGPGPNTMNNCLKYVLGAGYPCFQTEFYRWPWGTGNFALGSDASMYQDETETGMFERELISWLTFITINNFTNNSRFESPLNNAGIVWIPDYGAWPSGDRGTYGNGGQPWWTTNISSTLSIQAANYDTGGPGVGFYCPTNYSGTVYRSDDVGIESTSDTGGGYDVTTLASGEWLEYTTYINNAGYYYLEMRVASAQPTNQLNVSFYGKNATNGTGTVTFSGTGGSQVWTTITNIVFLPSGRQIMNLSMLSSGFNVHWVQLSPLQPGTFTNGIYKLINLSSGKAMEETGTSAGSKLDQNTYSGATSQQWSIGHVGGNEYYLTNLASGLVIDESSYTALSGDYIQMYTLANSINQRWIPIPTVGGYYKLASVNSGLVLEVAANGSSIDQSEYAGGGQQQWAILPLNANPPLPPPTALTANPVSGAQIDLSWKVASGASSYNVKRSATTGGPYTTVATGVTAMGYSDTGLSASTTYYYVVSSVNGSTESGDSSETNATTMTYGTEIVDNADPTGVTIVGSWTSSTSASGYYRTNYIHDGNTGSSGGKSVAFTPNLPESGNYDVYLNWTTGANRASNTPVDVIYSGGTNTYSLNQQVGGSWQLIGNFSFNSGTDGSLKIRNDGANGYVIADAVEFVLSSTNRPPAAPTALTAAGGNLVVNLGWTQSASPGITGNNVYRSTTGSGGPYSVLARLAATNSYSDTAVSAGDTYFYSVTATNGDGESALSAYSGAAPTPSAPSGLTATPGNNQAALIWSASTGAASYNVKRATTSGGPYTTIANPTGTSYTDTTAVNGTTYYYVVSAVNGSGESANSTEVAATPSAPAAPAVPTSLTASAGHKKVTLTWTQSASPNIVSNNVYRATVNGGPYTLVATIAATTTFANSGLTTGTTYYYVVTAVNSSSQESPYSNQASATAK
jgi:endoglucanase